MGAPPPGYSSPPAPVALLLSSLRELLASGSARAREAYALSLAPAARLQATTLLVRALGLCLGVALLSYAPQARGLIGPRGLSPARAYLRRYAVQGVEAILVGMNPGPWGMAQTGVPFGEVGLVRDFLAIDERVDRPAVEHPARPVEGFTCTRSEVSGRRFWEWARQRYRTPLRFSRVFLVSNYCPLVFMEESGRNRTPDKLPRRESEPLFAACDEALRRLVAWCRPGQVIGIGAFATARARVALDGLGLPVGTILHPSPASPLANRGWAERAEQQLAALGIRMPAVGRAARSPPR
jgi:single-strand selective monofunctional uracil DNA glycosylase